MAKKKVLDQVTPTQIKQEQKSLYQDRMKHSLRSLENVKTLRASKKLIAQYKTALNHIK